MSDFDGEREIGLIRIEILDWIDCGKVVRGRRCDMLLDEDWLIGWLFRVIVVQT